MDHVTSGIGDLFLVEHSPTFNDAGERTEVSMEDVQSDISDQQPEPTSVEEDLNLIDLPDAIDASLIMCPDPLLENAYHSGAIDAGMDMFAGFGCYPEDMDQTDVVDPSLNMFTESDLGLQPRDPFGFETPDFTEVFEGFQSVDGIQYNITDDDYLQPPCQRRDSHSLADNLIVSSPAFNARSQETDSTLNELLIAEHEEADDVFPGAIDFTHQHSDDYGSPNLAFDWTSFYHKRWSCGSDESGDTPVVQAKDHLHLPYERRDSFSLAINMSHISGNDPFNSPSVTGYLSSVYSRPTRLFGEILDHNDNISELDLGPPMLSNEPFYYDWAPVIDTKGRPDLSLHIPNSPSGPVTYLGRIQVEADREQETSPAPLLRGRAFSLCSTDSNSTRMSISSGPDADSDDEGVVTFGDVRKKAEIVTAAWYSSSGTPSGLDLSSVARAAEIDCGCDVPGFW